MVKVNYGIKLKIKRFLFNIEDFKEIYHRFDNVKMQQSIQADYHIAFQKVSGIIKW